MQQYDNNYDTKGRFASYWHQINEMQKLKPSKILEIGIGNGFIHNYFKNKGLKISTLDISKELNPDYVGSVLSMPFEDKQFDVCLCCEVLEHLPFTEFTKALQEIQRVSRNAVLSLPNASYYLVIQTKTTANTFSKIVSFPKIFNRVYKFDGEHYWEIGKKGYLLNKIKRIIKENGFSIEKCYRLFEMPYHNFFILSKT
jgi:ubiquinone/menaquinone biosynthesis C-methylase UbiE